MAPALSDLTIELATNSLGEIARGDPAGGRSDLGHRSVTGTRWNYGVMPARNTMDSLAIVRRRGTELHGLQENPRRNSPITEPLCLMRLCRVEGTVRVI
jgi:hypothetical protein